MFLPWRLTCSLNSSGLKMYHTRLNMLLSKDFVISEETFQGTFYSSIAFPPTLVEKNHVQFDIKQAAILFEFLAER